MSSLFTSDLHIGHKSIPKYRTRFTTASQHDEYMLDQIRELSKRDTLTIIGDFIFDGADFQHNIDTIQSFACSIKLVMGNHDSKKLYTLPQSSNISIQLPLYSFRNIWVSHCPIHPSELRSKLGNVHGHMHLNSLPDKRYLNANIDVNDYKFISIESIKNHYNT